ncbi:(-)-germacrene D synthase-like [Iris pallida]|uniref:(-)-germacrene D synthase-like n=1 Tax=Iris pallida TaxID=29817 RepID=A0AAX6H9Y9_IRIPA|nr:(-)-germacrene D synthase-like [Iris pallida]
MSAIEQRIEELKEEVKTLMFSTNDLAENLTLVDDLHRLGIYYHFEDEIREAIRCINDHVEDGINDIRLVALRFRLLRQEGYAVSPGMFNKFKDSEGKFKQELSYDVEGLIQMYEASMLGTNDEPILEEAMDFSRGHMERMLEVGEEPHSAQIRRALETPFHRGMRRLEARLYIPVYAKSKSCNTTLLELAKLDFNHLQSIHRDEIQSFSVWWKELGLMHNLPFFRDRLAECYFWSLGAWLEPRYSTERLFIAKLVNIITVLDDMYDAYGTIEELQLFTNVIERWDFQDVDGLPEYMRIFLNVFAGFMAEIEEELRKKGTLHHKHYIIETFKPLVRAYFQEAVWTNTGYKPIFEEYINVSLMSCAYPMFISVSLCLAAEDLSIDTLDCLLSMPKILKASGILCRIMDDLVSYEFERQRKHVDTCLEICMRDEGITEQEALAKLNKMVENAWKDINKECLNPFPSRKHLNMLALNYTRMMEVIYKHEDSYTNPEGQMKENIALLLVRPIEE